MTKYTSNIQEWIKRKTKEVTNRCECAFEKPFGFVNLQDGRKAQVIVTLEIDKENWI